MNIDDYNKGYRDAFSVALNAVKCERLECHEDALCGGESVSPRISEGDEGYSRAIDDVEKAIRRLMCA